MKKSLLLKVFVLTSTVAILLSGCSSSQDQSGDAGQGGTASDLYYLTPTSLPVREWPTAPFALGTPEETSDLAANLQFQNTRTDADCARANTEVDITLDSFYGPAYGPLSKKEVSALKDFFDKVINDASYFSSIQKDIWKRPRPFLVDSAIQPCIPLESSYSYPSGHSTMAHASGDVLDLIFPERKTQIDARADQIAHDRVLGGVHFLTDIAAGKQTGDNVFQALQQSSAYQQDLQAAKAAIAQ
jgi:acid phosphatase (class A)